LHKILGEKNMENIFQSTNSDLYNFDATTGEFLGKTTAGKDPLESLKAGVNIYSRTPFSTFIVPPETKENEIVVFKNDEWEIHQDFRGSVYYLENASKVTIIGIDEVVPENAILVAPPEGLSEPKFESGQWIETPKLKYCGIEVSIKEDVSRITRKRVRNECDEEKAKTLKIIAGDGPCPEWDEFLIKRESILQECDDFISANNLS